MIKFKTRQELAQALIEGERFKVIDGGANDKGEIYFDSHCNNPFRYKEESAHNDEMMIGVWDVDAFQYEETMPWYEDIPEQGVLCFVFDCDMKCALRQVVTGYNDRKPECKYVAEGVGWKHAVPIKLKDIKHTLLEYQ